MENVEMTPLDWNLPDLLKAGNVVGVRRTQLLALANTFGPQPLAAAYVSWRLKAVSQPKLQMPGVWAASQLLTYDGEDAGDVHSAYARLGPVALAYLLHWSRTLRATDSGYDLYTVAEADHQIRLNKQLTQFWGLYRRLWPVDLGLSALAARVAALGLAVDITQVQVTAAGDFYLAQGGAGQVVYPFLSGDREVK